MNRFVKQRFCNEEMPGNSKNVSDDTEDYIPAQTCKCRRPVVEPHDVCSYHLELPSIEALQKIYG